jgi:hypothetical protein
MTQTDMAARHESEIRVQEWKSSAEVRGLRGYFQRHNSRLPLWREIRQCLKSSVPGYLFNFGERGEFWELPAGDCVIVDPALALTN